MINATIAGNIGKDAETKSVGGSTVTEFSVASEEKVRDEKVTTWVRCAIWGKRGEALERYLTKGSKVTVVGTLTAREYTKDGQTRTSLDLRVDQLALQGGNKSEGRADRATGNSSSGFSGDSDGEFSDSDVPF